MFLLDVRVQVDKFKESLRFWNLDVWTLKAWLLAAIWCIMCNDTTKVVGQFACKYDLHGCLILMKS